MVTSSSVLALRINEVEANPFGADKDNEWVELYSETEVNLDGYVLENGDGGSLDLSGSFSGYKIINFSGLWLDNSGEKVLIKKDGTIVDETPLLDDAANKETSNSYCSGSWALIEATKGEQNSCEEQDEETDEQEEENMEDNNQEEVDEEEVEEEDEEQIVISNIKDTATFKEEKVEKKKIVLGGKEEKTITPREANQYVSREFYIRTGVVYSFIIFLILLVVLLLVRGRNI